VVDHRRNFPTSSVRQARSSGAAESIVRPRNISRPKVSASRRFDGQCNVKVKRIHPKSNTSGQIIFADALTRRPYAINEKTTISAHKVVRTPQAEIDPSIKFLGRSTSPLISRTNMERVRRVTAQLDLASGKHPTNAAL